MTYMTGEKKNIPWYGPRNEKQCDSIVGTERSD